ncbi:DUF6265 family protein [Cellulophaga sp. Hel_I_12]|uniref:DUF6265 family protein n=1 Tax=Cellulophaga sp. Hel_I_12 TaxID=1249972 RepID=UPI000648150E|nr:DUF6265 family protein [Cellulophaga sp. Hel_I_12]
MMKAFLLALLFSTICFSQNTLTGQENTPSPKATLADASFIQGHWKGEAFGGTTEEIWTTAMGNSMLFSFRLVVDGKVNFYEIGHILEKEDSLILQLKHFGADLKGWEEKDETQDFKLIKKEKNKLYFDGLTYEKISATEMNAHVVTVHKDGSKSEITFNFKKQ